MSEVFWNGWFSNLAYCLFFSITVFLFSTTSCTSTNPRHPVGEYFSSYQMASLVPETIAASLKLGFIFQLGIIWLIDFTECILFHNFKSYQQTAEELFLYYRKITIGLKIFSWNYNTILRVCTFWLFIMKTGELEQVEYVFRENMKVYFNTLRCHGVENLKENWF